jgi:demethoxyubiquinone hydroxylase (CLK1/Coq7/Cat5 family)
MNVCVNGGYFNGSTIFRYFKIFKYKQNQKIKIENKEQIIMEEKNEYEPEVLKEIFVQSSEIEAMPKGQLRDMQILRLGIIAEMDASNLYEKLALLASDKRIVKVMREISREEKVHVGEFESVLEQIDPEYEPAVEEGENEVDEMR